MEITVYADLDDVIDEIGGHYDPEDDELVPGQPVTLRDAVIDRLADKLLGELRQRELDKLIGEKATALLDELMRPRFEAAIAQTVQRTDGYGRPIGEKATIDDLILQAAERSMSEHVNSRGEPTNPGYGAVPRSTWLLQKVVTDHLTKTLTDVIETEAKRVKDALQQQAAKHLAEKLART